MIACIDDMRKAYEVVPDSYLGLHIDEVNKDMKAEFPGVAQTQNRCMDIEIEESVLQKL